MNIHQATVEVLMDFQSSHEPKGTAFTERYDLVIGNLVGNNLGYILQEIILYFNNSHSQYLLRNL